MKKKNEEQKKRIIFYLSYNFHFSYTKTSVSNDLKYVIVF